MSGKAIKEKAQDRQATEPAREVRRFKRQAVQLLSTMLGMVGVAASTLYALREVPLSTVVRTIPQLTGGIAGVILGVGIIQAMLVLLLKRRSSPVARVTLLVQEAYGRALSGYFESVEREKL